MNTIRLLRGSDADSVGYSPEIREEMNSEPRRKDFKPAGNTLDDQDELWDEFVRDSFYSRMSKAELKSKYLITRK